MGLDRRQIIRPRDKFLDLEEINFGDTSELRPENSVEEIEETRASNILQFYPQTW